MLDRLPVELIQLIVHLALPPHYSPSTYRGRQDTLLALCKTSRLLRTVAQPVLFEVVELKGKQGVKRFVEAVKDEALGKRVKVVRFEGPLEEGLQHSTVQTEEDLQSIATSCPNVVDVRFYRVKLDLKWLEAFTSLDCLVLSHGEVTYSTTFSLPTLQELSIFCNKLEAEHHLSPTAYPAIKRVHLQMDAYSNLSAVLLRDLLDQVDCLSLDAADLDGLDIPPGQRRLLLDYVPGELAAAADDDPALLTASKDWRLSPFAFRARVDHYSAAGQGHNLALFIEGLSNLEDTFAQHADLLPSRLYLALDTQLPSPLLSESQRVAVHNFLLICDNQNIEVIFEPLPDPLRESFVSPEFWRRCKALKAKEDAEQEKEAEEKGGEGGKKT